MGPKKFGVFVERQGRHIFWQDILENLPGYPGGSRKIENTYFAFNIWPVLRLRSAIFDLGIANSICEVKIKLSLTVELRSDTLSSYREVFRRRPFGTPAQEGLIWPHQRPSQQASLKRGKTLVAFFFHPPG